MYMLLTNPGKLSGGAHATVQHKESGGLLAVTIIITAKPTPNIYYRHYTVITLPNYVTEKDRDYIAII